MNKTIRIDEKLSIINGGDKEKKALRFLGNFIKSSKNINRLSGTYFLYEYKGDRKWYFEAETCVQRFLTAVRIYKETRCDYEVSFSIEDSRNQKYYKPFQYKERYNGLYYGKERSVITTRKELNIIKKIYFRLEEAKFSQTIYYSKLYNAVKFFNHSYDHDWTLLKTMLAFTALESLFSDSSKSDIAYKIALRVSYFLHPRDRNKRKEVFDIVKRGYEIRSHFVHGSDTEKKVNKLMKKFENEKQIEHYGFYHHFIFDLTGVVAQSLAKALVNKEYFNFFNNEKHSDDEEVNFFDKLVGI